MRFEDEVGIITILFLFDWRGLVGGRAKPVGLRSEGDLNMARFGDEALEGLS